MPDVHSIIASVDPAVVGRVADAMETSAADPQHRTMVTAYRGDLDLAEGAHLLEIGCGTGAIARVLAAWPGVGEVLGVDPSPILLTRARDLSEGIPSLSFEEGVGRRLALPDAGFDGRVAYPSGLAAATGVTCNAARRAGTVVHDHRGIRDRHPSESFTACSRSA